MLTQYLEYLLQEMRGKQDIIVRMLASNAVPNMEQYRLLNGKLQGLEDGINIAKGLYNSMVENRTLAREDVNKE